MKASLLKELEAVQDSSQPFESHPEIYLATRDAILKSKSYDVLELFYVFLANLFRGQAEHGKETPPVKDIRRKSFCLQFVPAIISRYLSLLVTQKVEEEMMISLIEAFFGVVCTSNSSKKLKKTTSLPELTEGIISENLILVPSLLKASVYMNNNEVLFPKDFISYPSNRLEFLRNRTEPSITKLDANNRQDVLAFTIQQYNSCLGDACAKSQEDFCQMCSCFVLSGFNLKKTKFASQAGSLPPMANRRLLLSSFLMSEMLQGLYQLSFYISLREASLRALEHVSFRARHSLMSNMIMLTDSVRTAIDRSCLKQDARLLILSEPEVSYQDRVGVVTSDSLRIAARRESIRLDKLENFGAGPHANGSEDLSTTGPSNHNSSANNRRLSQLDEDQVFRPNNATLSSKSPEKHYSNNSSSSRSSKSSNQNRLYPDAKSVESSPSRFKVQLTKDHLSSVNKSGKVNNYKDSYELSTTKITACSYQSFETDGGKLSAVDLRLDYRRSSNSSTGDLQPQIEINGSKRYKKNLSNQSSHSSRSSPKRHGPNHMQKSPNRSLVGESSDSDRNSPAVIFKMGDSRNSASGDWTQSMDGGYYGTGGSSLESSPSRHNQAIPLERLDVNEDTDLVTTTTKTINYSTSFKYNVESCGDNDVNNTNNTFTNSSSTCEVKGRFNGNTAGLYVDDEDDYALEGNEIDSRGSSKSTKRASVPLAVVTEL
ncbi:uncharacterized protein LOC142353005 isoform X2 [Convolutriloba macropyga]|uniref:uncharacterized protein LOC142353005 isoform X2 n=1 Tax=Convolutriloba macropyga TaxID=536237 RepID=UPI003F51F050